MGLVSPGAPPNTGHSHSNSYSQRLGLSEFDLRDDRYPTSLSSPRTPSNLPPAHSQSAGFDPAIDAGMTAALRASYQKAQHPGPAPLQKSWLGENITQEPVQGWDPSHSHNTTPGPILEAQAEQRASGVPPVDNYFPDQPDADGAPDRPPGSLPRASTDAPPQSPEMGQRSSSVRSPGDQYDAAAAGATNPRNAALSFPPGAAPGVGPSTPMLSAASASSPRHPSIPSANVGGSPNNPIVPLSAGPTYNPSAMQIPISPKPRAYAQHPTYITPSTAPAMQPSFSPPQVSKEEVCVECAMRDQDMADVDVTGPGVWERESDVLYEELCQRDAEEEAAGGHHSSSDSHSRPRAKGGKLTEENLRFWLSIVRCIRLLSLSLVH